MLPEFLNKYVGLPFLSHGRDADGVDCYGLVRMIYANEYGHDLPVLDSGYEDVFDYKNMHQMISFEKEKWIAVSEGTARPGDVILFSRHKALSHMGMVIGEGKFIHALEGVGVCIERLIAPAWRPKIRGYYRYAD